VTPRAKTAVKVPLQSVMPQPPAVPRRPGGLYCGLMVGRTPEYLGKKIGIL